MSILSFAQDFRLLDAGQNSLKINEIVGLFSQIVRPDSSEKRTMQSSTGEYLMNSSQFYSLIENLALKFHASSSKYITISEKIDAFFEQVILRTPAAAAGVLPANQSFNGFSQHIEWGEPVFGQNKTNTSRKGDLSGVGSTLFLDNKLNNLKDNTRASLNGAAARVQ